MTELEKCKTVLSLIQQYIRTEISSRNHQENNLYEKGQLNGFVKSSIIVDTAINNFGIDLGDKND